MVGRRVGCLQRIAHRCKLTRNRKRFFLVRIGNSKQNRTRDWQSETRTNHRFVERAWVRHILTKNLTCRLHFRSKSIINSDQFLE